MACVNTTKLNNLIYVKRQTSVCYLGDGDNYKFYYGHSCKRTYMYIKQLIEQKKLFGNKTCSQEHGDINYHFPVE